MRTLNRKLFIAAIVFIFISSCCKDKKICKQGNLMIKPFKELFYNFNCNNSNEYTYIYTNSKQIDSLKPTCFFTSPTFFPIDETNMRYFIVGRLSYHEKDTFQTVMLNDSCLKYLICEVNMIQRDTAYYFPDRSGGVLSMFCAVQNIPADYKVEVKYKYVPL